MSPLERTAHICLITVAIISAGILLERRFNRDAPNVGAFPSTSLIGKPLTVPGADWTRARLNTVLLVSTKCHFCEESMAFYRRLVESRQRGQGKFTISVLSREPSGTIKAFMTGRRVFVDGVYQFTPSDRNLLGTPELLIVDSGGAIRRAYIGKMSSTQEAEVLGLLQRGVI